MSASAPTPKNLPVLAQSGHIFYQPKGLGGAEKLWYDPEAYHIVYGKTDAPSDDNAFSDLCKQWADRLSQHDGKKEAPQYDFLGVYQSRRRKYSVTGARMFRPSGIEKERYYLFNVQRGVSDTGNLPMFARKWGLNPREQEIVRRLAMDQSNKEIAYQMGLTVNTIKGYLKLLIRKMGVSSRVGIVALLLSGKKTAQ